MEWKFSVAWYAMAHSYVGAFLTLAHSTRANFKKEIFQEIPPLLQEYESHILLHFRIRDDMIEFAKLHYRLHSRQ